MTATFQNILLVEDSASDAEQVQRFLDKAGHSEFRMAIATTLAQGENIFKATPIDVVLLDQNLPDSIEGQSLAQCMAWCIDTPIIVLTGFGDDEEGARRVRQGAQDYLVKGSFDATLLLRVIRYTLERSRLQKDMAILKLREQKAIEIKSLEAMDSLPLPSTGSRSLRGAAPVYYADLIMRYENFLEVALEQRIYRQDRSANSENIRSFTTELARYGAGPREIVDIHSTALERRLKGQSEAKAQAYLEEARLLLLETMGAMVQTYRSKFTIREGAVSLPSDAP